jgi:hypothetical protein
MKLMTQTEFWSLLVDSLSTILAAIAILLYIIIWKKDKSTGAYDVFDGLYLDILKTGIEHPHLRDLQRTADYKNAFNHHEQLQYEAYAFICWNFIETIYDRADDELFITWMPALEAETQLHLAWFYMPENQTKFKEAFKCFVKEKLS